MNSQHKGIGMTSQRTRDRLIDRLRQEGIQDERVLEVMRHTPRHMFMDEALNTRAYEDTALPIGQGQTISQPYIVARMTEALLQENIPQRVLEVGTGSGYQTAILAPLIKEVYSIERIQLLLAQAQQRLRQLKLNNIHFRHADGYVGWPEHAPFDAIIVTAAPVDIPQELLEQLAEGGKLVLPVGTAGTQELILIHKENGEYHQKVLDRVSFVPLKEGLI